MRYKHRTAWVIVAMACAALAACTGGSSSDAPLPTPVPTPGAVSGVASGRLLASNCYQCHGTYGSGGFDRIMGKGDLLGELRKYATSTKTDDIMAAHVQGYTDAQLQAIATYLAKL